MAEAFTKIRTLAVNAGHWWLNELAACVPERFKKDKSCDGAITVRFEDDGLEIRCPTGKAEIVSASDTPENIKEAVARFTDDAKTSVVEMLLHKNDFFTVTNTYPEKARDKLQQLTMLEITRSMPFDAGEVYADTIVTGGDPNRSTITVLQAFAKRSRIDFLLERMETFCVTLSAIRLDRGHGDINLLPRDYIQKHSRGARLQQSGLVAVMIVSIVIAAFALAARQDRALAGLDEKLTEARAAAAKARNAGDAASTAKSRISAIRGIKRTHPSVLQVWEDLTRALPDSAWLVEFKLNGATGRVSGYADSAAPLINALESTAGFSDVSFAAPVTLDRRQSREKFTMTFTFHSNEDDVKTTLVMGEQP